MGRLRSRWTVVALVPAVFLLGFGLVSALAGGSDDGSSPQAAQLSTPGENGGGAVTVAGQTDDAATPTDTGSETTGENGGSVGAAGGMTTASGGAGGIPPAPPPGVIDVQYGQWDGFFELANPSIQPDFAQASVLGELHYLGGVDCQVGLDRVKAWLFGDRGLHVGTTVWESTQSTGDGGEVSGREPVVFEAVSMIDQAAESAVLRFVAVECV